MKQFTIPFGVLKESTRYGGDTIEPDRDNARLDRQMGRVLKIMADGEWHALWEIAARTNDPESSISARLRDLRKARWGSLTVERRYVRRGLFEYRVVK